jgi:hypothetical protein
VSGIAGDVVPWARDGIFPATRKLVDGALFLAVVVDGKKVVDRQWPFQPSRKPNPSLF